jgi:two-component system chemotaxis sensor kinase CheA
MRPEAHGPRRVGIVVRSVLDVSAGTLLAEDTTVCEGQLAMVKKRVTMVHGEFSRRAALPPMENMKEVA